MIQFDLNRFGKLARWSLTNDRKYYIKSFLQLFVTLLFAFMFFTEITFSMSNAINPNYRACAVITMLMFLVTFIVGPAYMFYSMEGKHDRQALLMLPASNFEKYLMRYSTWIILLPIYVVAFFGADLLQYVYHVLSGHQYATFVTAAFSDTMSELWKAGSDGENEYHVVNSMISTAILTHSFFALGATFFRSRKFNWVLTAIVILLGISLIVWLSPDKGESASETTLSTIIITDAFFSLWTILNFWLSYRLFCRTQVIGKFVNL